MSSAAKVDVFQAIADPTRRTLLKLLGKQEMSVAQMTGHFSISRTAVNKHLHILSDAGLVSHHKVGRETRYQLQPDNLRELKDWLNYFEQFWDNKLAMLKFLVEQDEDSPEENPPLRLVEKKPPSE
ncbi:ArsR/SmtB family transcription factor [Tumebacillus flagellatus]|uniref:ArsR family transcriptional regulator n=1 Tax=Tumebacillus flagellatus TaxID=1157490 RepID=A0A074MFM3_9BACL|nr:metalloregulator ArsR/SmtB family transcription factor [Tumebacillus flagellatus]KEO84552.1 ArsR family transcriptional regulator [Tumebacillus flagellatus]